MGSSFLGMTVLTRRVIRESPLLRCNNKKLIILLPEIPLRLRKKRENLFRFFAFSFYIS